MDDMSVRKLILTQLSSLETKKAENWFTSRFEDYLGFGPISFFPQKSQKEALIHF